MTEGRDDTAVTLEQDRELLQRFRRGDAGALAQVFQRYAQHVAHAVRTGVLVQVDGQLVRVGAGLPEHEVEALVQETFVRAFAPRTRDAYDGLRPYAAYLLTIARNLVIDRGRRQRSAGLQIPLDKLESDRTDCWLYTFTMWTAPWIVTGCPGTGS